jgi:nucleotide sugar dehydrogenase
MDKESINDSVLEKENDKKITIIGIGNIGLGFSLLLEKNGYNVIGVDFLENENYVKLLNEKVNYTSTEPEFKKLLNESKKFKATTSLQEGLSFSNIIFIFVQLPISNNVEKYFDHSVLSNLIFKINKLNPENKHIIISSTVMASFTKDIGSFLLQDCNNVSLSYNPEFVEQGNIINGFQNPDLILCGTYSEELKPILNEIYTKITFREGVSKTPTFLTPIEAEIVKLALNSYITTKIAFANTISDLCNVMNNMRNDTETNFINKNVVLESIGLSSSIGNKHFKAFENFKGPCFPKDLKAFKKLLDNHFVNSKLLEGTIEYNNEHLVFQVEQLIKEDLPVYYFENVGYSTESDMNEIDGSRVPVIEESLKLKIARVLVFNYGKNVVIQDNKDTIEEVMKEYGNLFNYEIII